MSEREVFVDGGSGVNRIQACKIYSPSNMNTDSEFVFSGRGGNDSNREAENLKEDYVPTEIHVRSGSKVIRKMKETQTFTDKNESVMDEVPPESKMYSKS